ncbi:MAG: helix-turn-helix transcriptional regulator [Rhizomicrobium sp.]
MKRRGVTQADVAKVLGKDRSHVSRIVSGLRRARARERRLVAQFLGVSIAAIFPRRYCRRDRAR